MPRTITCPNCFEQYETEVSYHYGMIDAYELGFKQKLYVDIDEIEVITCPHCNYVLSNTEYQIESEKFESEIKAELEEKRRNENY